MMIPELIAVPKAQHTRISMMPPSSAKAPVAFSDQRAAVRTGADAREEEVYDAKRSNGRITEVSADQ